MGRTISCTDPVNVTYQGRTHVAVRFGKHLFGEDRHMTKHGRHIEWREDFKFSTFDPSAVTCKTCRNEFDLDDPETIARYEREFAARRAKEDEQNAKGKTE